MRDEKKGNFTLHCMRLRGLSLIYEDFVSFFWDCMWKSFSHVQLFVTGGLSPARLLCP